MLEILKIIRSGSLTTIQDLGRRGYAHYGVPISGAMDSYAFQIANLLVGNERNAPALEMTLLGAKVEFLAQSVIAITGGQGVNTLNGNTVPNWRSLKVKAGDVLDIGVIREGCRVYLSVANGFEVPKILGSASTYLPARLGGLNGCNIHKDDILEAKPWFGSHIPKALALRWVPSYTGTMTLRVLPGIDQESFSKEMVNQFYSADYEVQLDSDRKGCRLRGTPLKSGHDGDRVSDAVLPGVVQVPPDGQPIILGVEQTTGGYPVIAVVASVDLPLVGQLAPGQPVCFEEISCEEAQRLRLDMENFLSILEITPRP